jgi:hypothetical protein
MFQKCQTTEETKTLFRKLAKYLHPDVGGDTQLMILLQETYEMHLHSLENQKMIGTTESEPVYTPIWIYKDDPRTKVVYEILKYAKYNKRFDDTFVASIKDQLEANGKISQAQLNSILKVYKGFKMEQFLKDKEDSKCK